VIMTTKYLQTSDLRVGGSNPSGRGNKKPRERFDYLRLRRGLPRSCEAITDQQLTRMRGTRRYEVGTNMHNSSSSRVKEVPAFTSQFPKRRQRGYLAGFHCNSEQIVEGQGRRAFDAKLEA
jgi:hypothetical protein